MGWPSFDCIRSLESLGKRLSVSNHNFRNLHGSNKEEKMILEKYHNGKPCGKKRPMKKKKRGKKK